MKTLLALILTLSLAQAQETSSKATPIPLPSPGTQSQLSYGFPCTDTNKHIAWNLFVEYLQDPEGTPEKDKKIHFIPRVTKADRSLYIQCIGDNGHYQLKAFFFVRIEGEIVRKVFVATVKLAENKRYIDIVEFKAWEK